MMIITQIIVNFTSTVISDQIYCPLALYYYDQGPCPVTSFSSPKIVVKIIYPNYL